jgi:hypothetical protein
MDEELRNKIQKEYKSPFIMSGISSKLVAHYVNPDGQYVTVLDY